MTHKYLALLRGINVGGNAVIKMADLKQALVNAGFQNVRTYIQSGNILFDAASADKLQLASHLQNVLAEQFKLTVSVALFTDNEWQQIVVNAPAWWGKDPVWKHNLLAITEPLSTDEVLIAIGEPKPDIEYMQAGNGVIYQSVCFAKFGRSTTSKLAANPIYKSMTIRNYNTATKLVALF